MSVWRRKAVELFPDLKQDFQVGNSSSYLVFGSLLSNLWQALETDDDVTLYKIFEFAEWCSNQKAEHLWNAAGVSFYEHVFDQWEYREKVLVWLSPNVIANHEGLWEWRLSEDKLKEIKKLTTERTEHNYRGFSVDTT